LFLTLVATVAFAQSPSAAAGDSDPQGTYALAPNDLVLIKVFQEDDLDSKLRISKEGTVTFPLIGVVGIGGKTPQEAANTIKELLGKRFLRNPQVNLTVIEYAKRRFTVLGQVQRPGVYSMPDRDAMVLLQAIGMAGGYTRNADPAKITVKRTAGGKESVYKLNAKTMANQGTSSKFEIHADDVISVGESIF
jgi:polysaccharide export outer membrane protein